MSDTVSGVFAALADPTRRDIYERLLEEPTGLTATELVGVVTVSRQAISKHLQVLVRCGVAVARRDGREVRFVAAPGGTSGASAWLLEHERAWDRRLGVLEDGVRARRPSPHGAGGF
jgi:DNA-binding transcriptional ArsR family regulator